MNLGLGLRLGQSGGGSNRKVGGLLTETKAIIALIASEGQPPLSIATITAINTAIKEMRQTILPNGKSIWQSLDGFWWFPKMGSSTAALINWVNPISGGIALLIESSGTVLPYNNNTGFTGDKSRGINTRINLSTAANYKKDSACLGVWNNSTDGTQTVIGSRTAFLNKMSYIELKSDAPNDNGVLRPYINMSENKVTANTYFSDLGLFCCDRPNSSTVNLYLNGMLQETLTTTSKDIHDGLVAMFGVNNGGTGDIMTFSRATNRNLFGGFISASMEEKQAEFSAIIQKLKLGTVG